MFRWNGCLIFGFAALFFCEVRAGDPAPLPQESLARATRADTLTIPTPGELFAALNKEGKPNWQGQYRAPIPTAFSSRAQIALNLGGLLADGYIAVEAEDSQHVKNVGRDIIALAKSLGVSQTLIGRGNSITEFADRNDWSGLKEELEATQNEVRLAMEGQHDKELPILVSLGGWIRGTEAVTAWISENYSPASARLLRQPALLNFMRSKIRDLPEKLQEDALVKTVSLQLAEMEKLVSFPRDAPPSIEDVKKIKSLASELNREISKKAQK